MAYRYREPKWVPGARGGLQEADSSLFLPLSEVITCRGWYSMRRNKAERMCRASKECAKAEARGGNACENARRIFQDSQCISDSLKAEVLWTAQVSKAYAAAEAASVAVETAEVESKAGNSQDATAAGAAATLESAKVRLIDL